jgi:hypothetical protein
VVWNPFHIPIVQEQHLGLLTFDLQNTPPIPAVIVAELSGTHTTSGERITTATSHSCHTTAQVERVF